MLNHPNKSKAPAIFQTLAADGAAASEDQRSLSRKLTMMLAVALLTLGPLGWAFAAQAASADTPQAVLSGKQAAAAADDDDDDDDTGGSNPGTGRETAGNTDAGGQNTGVSTRGETDGRDGTGATERTQGTGAETQGDSDNGQDTGVKTGNDTDGDATDSIAGNGTDTGAAAPGGADTNTGGDTD